MLKDKDQNQTSVDDFSLQIWINRQKKQLFFSEKEGLETVCFESNESLMEYVRDEINQNYSIG